MSAIEILEQLGANPEFSIDHQSKQELLKSIAGAPRINFMGIVPAEDDDDSGDDSGDDNIFNH